MSNGFWIPKVEMETTALESLAKLSALRPTREPPPTWLRQVPEWAMKGLEYGLWPFAEAGMETREAITGYRERGWIPPSGLTPEQARRGIFPPERLPGGEEYEEFRELPLWQQLAYEAPAWGAAAMLPTATGLRAVLAPAAARPGVAGVLPTAARAALAPPAVAEAVIGAGLKYGIIIPTRYIVTAPIKKTFEIALDKGLDKWLVRQGIRGDEANAVIRRILEVNNRKLFETAKEHLLKRRTQRIHPNRAAQYAAQDTVREMEPLLLKAVNDVRTGIAPSAPMPMGQAGPMPPANVGRGQALLNIKTEFYDAVPNSALDRAATIYLTEGNFTKYILEMPDAQALSPEAAEQMGIALRTTGAGKLVPAMRRSGFHVTEDFANYPLFEDVGYVQGMWMDPTRMTQAIDGGFFNGATQRYVLWPTHRTSLASLRFTDTGKADYRAIIEKYGMVGQKKLRQAAGDVIQHISQAEKGLPIKELVLKPKISKIVYRFGPQMAERIVGYAQETRKIFDTLILQQNEARASRLQDIIPYKDNYRPWVAKTNIHGRLFGLKKTPANVMGQPQLPDYIKPTAPFNPRAMAREGGMAGYEKERDLQKLVFDYIDIAAKDIFNTNIIHNAKIHAATLRSMGLNNSASLIEDWVAEAYAGITPGVARGIRRVVPMKVIKPALWLRRRLTSAVFPLNWTWNFFVQTSSGALTIMRYGVANSLRGLEYMFNPKARAEVQDKAYSWIIKQRQAGRVAYQDLGKDIEKHLALEGSAFDKFEHYLNFLTSAIEREITGVSIRAAYYDGLQKGFKADSRELWEYASEGGSKTQSMYNLQDLPGVLRAKEIGALAPFQTFAFEVMNSVRELNLIGIGKAGAYQTISATSATGKATIRKRVKMLLEWFAAITVINLYVDKAINRKPWSSSSFIPFFAVLSGGVNAGNPWNQALPLKYTQDLWNGIGGVIRYGNWKKLRGWCIKYHVPAGLQVNRMLEGLEATLEGKVTDVRGRELFRVKPEEWWKAIFMGVYTTKEGREYIDKLKKSKGGILYELGGVPIPMPAKKEGLWEPPPSRWLE